MSYLEKFGKALKKEVDFQVQSSAREALNHDQLIAEVKRLRLLVGRLHTNTGNLTTIIKKGCLSRERRLEVLRETKELLAEVTAPSR